MEMIEEQKDLLEDMRNHHVSEIEHLTRCINEQIVPSSIAMYLAERIQHRNYVDLIDYIIGVVDCHI